MAENDRQGRVIWITGYSGAGKTTIAQGVRTRLREAGTAAVLLDGDTLREIFGRTNGHSKADRLPLAMTYAKLCRELASQGLDVVCATMSLFAEVHAWNREHIPNYVEVFLHVPFEELQRRDPKGLYARAASGALTNIAGLDLEVDEPAAPNLRIDNHSGVSPERAITLILNHLGEVP